MPPLDTLIIPALKRLRMTLGVSTPRMVVYCPKCHQDPDISIEDNISNCVGDAYVVFDPISLSFAYESQTSNDWRCNECGHEGAQGFTYIASNEETIARHLEALAATVALPERIKRKRITDMYDYNLMRTEIPHCDTCGGTEIGYDSFIRYDPYTGALHDPQTFEAECTDCDDDQARWTPKPCSAHEEIQFTIDRVAAADAAKAEMAEILAWIEEHGHAYGITPDGAKRFRAEQDDYMRHLLPARVKA